MRPKERIPEILDRIKAAWEAAPDMRFGQLLINMGVIEDSPHNWGVEDDITLDKVKNVPWKTK